MEQNGSKSDFSIIKNKSKENQHLSQFILSSCDLSMAPKEVKLRFYIWSGFYFFLFCESKN